MSALLKEFCCIATEVLIMGAEHSHDVERRRDYEKEEIKLRNVLEKCVQGTVQISILIYSFIH